MPAFLLGHDLAPLLDARERRALDEFCDMARSPNEPNGTQALLMAKAGHRFNDDPDELVRRIDAFGRGLGDAGAGTR